MRTRGLMLCRDCHDGIHDLIPDEKVLGWNYPTRELLLENEAIRRHVEWARKKR
ncbi:MAG: hypothetical protein SFX72_08430 [Isosphaeraceae bacterium]|nr:hypothetical protein [Isosphaeraceae bacterium]